MLIIYDVYTFWVMLLVTISVFGGAYFKQFAFDFDVYLLKTVAI